jgi:hypothetical protein
VMKRQSQHRRLGSRHALSRRAELQKRAVGRWAWIGLVEEDRSVVTSRSSPRVRITAKPD